ncbi:agmatinase [Acholeplasma laidlawii]|uniref:Putative agmatinase n=1 Tax=Acholeplasma laidlawii (strain PG-8A) TaxID=441768 RepID=A9NHT1_ACHLI|nr:agmatinase [Acholeplasma laidlawii]ABX81911.1 putative agmatinase [Acholeplasma laidlawii PG-8A]NWH10893.1 agmatinase [Acholeplasma laidlawii]OED27958.1 agmatinase [Acholeplasma laidlawii]OED29300.1 agmatinase [Acholeplasma laidlawii]OWU87397.1 agmatinase [Acholeplasma laidlawii]
MKLSKVDLSFQSCTSSYDEADVVIYSVPMDATTSFRPGTRFAGNAIRVDSFGVEWYSPYRDADLKDFKTVDTGDLDLPIGAVEDALDIVYEATKTVIKDGKKPMVIGGEHLITYPVLKALHEKYNDLHVIHLDAHTDLREEFFGRELSHATFMRQAHKFLGDHKIFQFGIRSGDKHEFEWAKKHIHQQKFDFEGLDKIVEQIKDKPVYITIDLDVLDPAVFPGTGTPEPGGMQYKDLLWAFDQFEKLNHIVGADIVELSPYLDPSGASNAVAAKSLRELILILHKNKNK